jgi:hypothetical protein
MYFPFFVLPYQRVPCLWYTPDSVLTHTIPAFFVCDVGCFAEPEDAGVVDVGVAEGEEVEAGFAVLGAAAGVAAAGGLSELPDCGDWACIAEILKASMVTTSVEARNRVRDSFFVSCLIVLFLTGFCFSLQCAPAGTQARWNSGMMAKKAGEVNMEEGQIRWPNGQ